MSFTVREVSQMLGLTPAQIRGFASKGFLTPERGSRGELRFGFHDLVILRTAGELTTARIPQRKVERVLEKLREQLPAGRSLAGLRIAADGDRVVVRDGGAVWNPESGQSLFDFTVDEIAEVVQAHEAAQEMPVEEWFELACDLEATDPDSAIDLFKRVLEADPQHADAHVNLGRLLHERRAPVAAEKHYRAALEADPDHDTAAFNLGVALEDMGRFGDAIQAYETALRINPKNGDAHYNLAGLYERRGDKAAAVRHLKACKALNRR